MKAMIKTIAEIGPLLIFFFGTSILKKKFPAANGELISDGEIYGIGAFIIATIIVVPVLWVLERKIPYMAITIGVFVTTFGLISIYLADTYYIQLKPTIINLIFAGILIFSQVFYKKNLLKFVFDQKGFNLTEKGWNALNIRWPIFFVFLALLNEILRNPDWFTYAEWLQYKVYIVMPISFIFMLVFIMPILLKENIKK